jgi:flagellar FliJ protein
MRDQSTGQMLQFFPMFIQGKKDEIKNRETLLWSLRKKYDKKIAELATARGEVKIMENFKDKKKDEWKKEKNKKEQEAIDEIIMMRNGSKDMV